MTTTARLPFASAAANALRSRAELAALRSSTSCSCAAVGPGYPSQVLRSLFEPTTWMSAKVTPLRSKWTFSGKPACAVTLIGLTPSDVPGDGKKVLRSAASRWSGLPEPMAVARWQSVHSLSPGVYRSGSAKVSNWDLIDAK
jgi:hypothetical protein